MIFVIGFRDSLKLVHGLVHHKDFPVADTQKNVGMRVRLRVMPHLEHPCKRRRLFRGRRSRQRSR